MKSSSGTLLVILVLQAVLVMGIFAAVAEEQDAAAVGTNDRDRDRDRVTNGGKLNCCSNCKFSGSGSGLYTCDDVVKKCDPVCKKCASVRTAAGKRFQCADTFLGVCGPTCKNKNY